MTAPAALRIPSVETPLGDEERSALADKLIAQAEALHAMAASLRRSGNIHSLLTAVNAAHGEPSDKHDVSQERWARDARRIYEDRRCRDRIFSGGSLFGEPAWDMLLDLTASEFSGRKLSVTSACIGACVPPTTALRYLSDLERAGYIVREKDVSDGRRAFIRISPEGLRKMLAYFAEMRRTTV